MNTYKKRWFALALSLDKDDTMFAFSDKSYICPHDDSFLYALFLSLSKFWVKAYNVLSRGSQKEMIFPHM